MGFSAVRLVDSIRSPKHLPDINALQQELSPGADEIDFGRLCEVVRHSRIWVIVESPERIVGMATLVPARTLHGYVGHVEDVAILQEHRGKGLGRMVMEYLIKDATAQRMTFLHLTSRKSREEANHLYPAVGFELRDTNVYRLRL